MNGADIHDPRRVNLKKKSDSLMLNLSFRANFRRYSCILYKIVNTVPACQNVCQHYSWLCYLNFGVIWFKSLNTFRRHVQDDD